MKPPRTKKDIQKLSGCLTALKRFISKLAENCLPFFDLLKGAKNKKEINWTPECKQAIEIIKDYLADSPVLSKYNPRKPLYLYLSSEPLVVGAALIREEGDTKFPVYYISQVLLL